MMKRKYKNIVVPYIVYNDYESRTEYIYNDKLYTDLPTLLKDFIGVNLVYHYKIDSGIQEVNDLDKVVSGLLDNYKEFRIPNKYRKEYSDIEYEYLERILKVLKGEKEPRHRKPDVVVIDGDNDRKMSKGEQRYLEFLKEMKQYNDVESPKKVHSEVYDRDYYAFWGEGYYNATSAMEEYTGECCYYQFNGDGIEDSENHDHEHEFDYLIKEMFRSFGEIKIYDYQKQFYSNQELNIIYLINRKLKELGFVLEPYKYDEKSYEKWKYYKDNNKKIRLFFHEMKEEIQDRNFRRRELKRHKK